MQTWLRALLLTGLMAMAGCLPQSRFPSLGEPSAGTEERRILVTFVDQSIRREVPGSPQDRYLVRGHYVNSSWSSRVARELAERHHLRLVAEWPVTVLGVACVVYEVPTGRNLDEAIRTIVRDPQVESAQIMKTFRAMGVPDPGALPYSDPYFRLQKDLQAMNIPAAQRLATGRGIRVAVIDSGVDGSHPDLRRQVDVSENLAVQRPNENTQDIHGTAVAGIIAAEARNGVGIVGIAPDAELIALRACWPERPGAAEALCNSFTLALAVNEAIRLGAQIINFSLTGPEDPLVGRLIRAALDRGILAVASDPGERGPDSGFPAHLDGVIAVRLQAPEPPQRVTKEEALAAPGSGILTTLPHATYDFVSGSSFAAPHITGILAMMRELNPRLTRQEALAAFRSARNGTVPPLRVVDACLALARFRADGECRAAPDASREP
jgi:subtilisin family serine protease